MYSIRSKQTRAACAGLLCLGIAGVHLQPEARAAHAAAMPDALGPPSGLTLSAALSRFNVRSAISPVAASAAASVVGIEVRRPGGPMHVASGFVVRSDTSGTYIVTVAHVLAGAKLSAVTIYASSIGKSYAALAMTLGSTKSGTIADLAVLRLRQTSLKPLSLGDSTTVRGGDTLTSIGIGAASRKPPVREQNVVTSIHRDLHDSAGAVWIQHQTGLGANAAGGPMVNLKGLVESINITYVAGKAASSAAGSTSQFYAVPSARARTLIDRMVLAVTTARVAPAATVTPTPSPTATNSATPVPPTATATATSTATAPPTSTPLPPTATPSPTASATPVSLLVTGNGYSLTLAPGWVTHSFADGTPYYSNAADDVEFDVSESVSPGVYTDADLGYAIGQLSNALSTRFGRTFNITYQHIMIGPRHGLRGTLISADGLLTLLVDVASDGTHLIIAETSYSVASSQAGIQEAAQIEQTISPTN